MIKFKREEVTKPRIETTYVEHKCDICKRDSPNPGTDDWNDSKEDYYRIDEIEISRKMGYSYPGDHWWEINEEVHICPACWESEFLPWLHSFDAAPTDMSERYK